VGLKPHWIIAGVDLDVKNLCASNLQELFRYFWQETDAVNARAFFDSWYAWEIRSRLDPIKKVAQMLKNRIDRILTWFSPPISNGPAERLHCRIQAIKSAARGFRIFEHYRIRIPCFCGKLSLKPIVTNRTRFWPDRRIALIQEER
jgi:hypothetical protein